MTGVGIRSFESPDIVRREILRYAQCGGCEDASMIDMMEKCIEECKTFASFSYRVSYVVLDIRSCDSVSGHIDLDSLQITSRDLARNLDGCDRTVLFAATIGPGIDRLIRKYSRLDPAKALFMQAIGAERIESLCNMFCATFPDKLRPRFSPGFGDLTLAVQPDVLRMTNAAKNLSITLDDGFLMSPSKSVTAFAGICSQMAERP